MDPGKWQLSLAECAAFQASLEPFFEGLLLRDLYFGEAPAMEKLRAIGKYNAFFEKNQQYYENVEPAARIAVLGGDDRAVPALNALAARNVQFDVIFSADQGKRYAKVISPGETPGEFKQNDPLTVDAPATVLYNVVRQQSPRRLLLHLLNYSQQPLAGIRVAVREPVASVRLLSPDLAGVRDLAHKAGRFVVPELRTYDLVSIALK
jgi:hypothetical protein